MKKINTLFALVFALFVIRYTLYVHTSYAVCPVCTIAVGAGLGISRTLGIDDVITSIWIGGLILSSSFWLIDWLEKKYKLKSKYKYSDLVVTILIFTLALVPLWLNKTIGLSHNKIAGIDKILFGTGVGSLGFLAGVYIDKKIRQKFGKQFINYQKVIVPISILVILSLLTYYILGKLS
jgi:hypothetical protein